MELLVCDVADLFPRQLFFWLAAHAKLAVGVFDLLLLYPDIVSCDSYHLIFDFPRRVGGRSSQHYSHSARYRAPRWKRFK